jgi:hypothetical protein
MNNKELEKLMCLSFEAGQQYDGPMDISSFDTHKLNSVREIIAYNLNPEWISVKDRLPDGNESVLFYSQMGWSIGFKAEGYWVCYNHGHLDSVTHWMPLPQPPNHQEQ